MICSKSAKILKYLDMSSAHRVSDRQIYSHQTKKWCRLNEALCMENFRGLMEMEKCLPAKITDTFPSNADTVAGKTRRIS